MKYIMKYEGIIPKPTLYLEVGDYVICNESPSSVTRDFTKDKIGQFIGMNGDGDRFRIKYDDIEVPEIYRKFFKTGRMMREDEIKYWAKDKNELLVKKTADKYNL